MGFLSSALGFVGKVFGAIFKPIGKLLKKWLAPDIPDKEGLTIQRTGSDQPIPVVYGTRRVGAIVVDKNVTDQSGGAKNEFLHLMCVFCYGEIDAFEEFFFNGISWNDNRWNKKGGGKWFTYETRTGAAGQTAVNAAGKLNRFSSTTSKYDGLAVAFFTIQMDKDQSVWRGEPEITARIRGKKCYDWRTATTIYTENPVVHLVDYLKSTVYGKSLVDGDLNYATLTATANICDVEQTGNTVTVQRSFYDQENRTYVNLSPVVTIETFKRFTHNNIIDTSRTIFQNMQEIANSFRGYFPESDGRISVGTEIEGSSVFSFDDDNIMSSITSTSPGKNDRYNRAVVRFPNALDEYKKDEVFYPASDDPLYQQWLDEDNGVPLEKTITADYTVYKAEALQLAELIVKVSRNGDQVQFTAVPEAAELDVGDIIDITNDTRGWVGKEFRIADISYRQDHNVDITAVEHNNTVYPWSTAEYDENIGGSFLGDPYSLLAPTNLTLTQDPTLAETGLLTWDAEDNQFIRRYEIVLVGDASNVVLEESSISRSYPIPLLDTGSYTVSVYAVSSIGTRSPEAALEFTLDAPAAPSSLTTTAGDWEIEVAPQLAGVGLGTVFEFDFVQGDGTGHTPSSKGRASTFTFTGLLPNTLHTVYARSVNAYGESAWISKQVTTTNTGAQVEDFIEESFAINIQPIENEIDALNDELGGVDNILEQVSQDISEIGDREVVKVRLEQEELVRREALIQVNQDLSTLNDFTIPILNNELDELNNVTLPQVQSDLDSLEGKFPITSTDITDEAITTPKLAANSVDASKIVALSITGAEIAGQTISADKIVANTITGNEIAANAISASKIVANAVTTDKMAANSINGDRISAATLDAGKIVSNTITTLQIQSRGIAADRIVANSITAGEIAASTITGDRIAANTILADNIAANTITGDEIAALSITADEIASNAITSAKITAGAIDGFLITGATIQTATDASPNPRAVVGGGNGYLYWAGTGAQSGKGLWSVDTSGNVYTSGQGEFDDGLTVQYNNNTLEVGRTTAGSTSNIFRIKHNYTNPVSGKSFVVQDEKSTGAHRYAVERYDGVTLETQSVFLITENTFNFSESNVVIQEDLTVSGTITNFTGAHKSDLSGAEPEVGDVMSESNVVISDQNNAWGNCHLSDSENDTKIAGAWAGGGLLFGVGEAVINVCGMNGDIEQGDLLTSSSITGKAQKQFDDIVRSHTIGKARQSVTFDYPEQVKQIACYYYCG